MKIWKLFLSYSKGHLLNCIWELYQGTDGKTKWEKIKTRSWYKSLLQEQVISLKHTNLQMQNSKGELEQYRRQFWLKINGGPVKLDETSDDVLKYVKEMFNECELDISDTVIDWTNWIGLEYSDYKAQKKCKAVVRFTMFRHITLVHKARKKIRNNVKIRLYLTKERHTSSWSK